MERATAGTSMAVIAGWPVVLSQAVNHPMPPDMQLPVCCCQHALAVGVAVEHGCNVAAVLWVCSVIHVGVFFLLAIGFQLWQAEMDGCVGCVGSYIQLHCLFAVWAIWCDVGLELQGYWVCLHTALRYEW